MRITRVPKGYAVAVAWGEKGGWRLSRRHGGRAIVVGFYVVALVAGLVALNDKGTDDGRRCVNPRVVYSGRSSVASRQSSRTAGYALEQVG